MEDDLNFDVIDGGASPRRPSRRVRIREDDPLPPGSTAEVDAGELDALTDLLATFESMPSQRRSLVPRVVRQAKVVTVSREEVRQLRRALREDGQQ